jgi:ketosteroid isomerase-like protein
MDLPRIATFLTDDCTVWFPPSAATQGIPRPLKGREAYLELVRGLQQRSDFFKVRSFELRRIFSDGDAVAVYLRYLGDMPNGAVYDNDYVFLYTFEGDKIAEIREFTDTSFIDDFLSRNTPNPPVIGAD